MSTLDVQLSAASSMSSGLRTLLKSIHAQPGEIFQFTGLASLEPAGGAVSVSSLSIVQHPPGAPSQADLVRLWELAVRYRDTHEITTSESVYQADRIMETMGDLLIDMLGIVGCGVLDEETDEYIGGLVPRSSSPR